MFTTISLPAGVLRWWVAPVAYVCSMVVLIAASGIGMPPKIGQAAVFVGYVVLVTVIALILAKKHAANALGIAAPQDQRSIVIVAVATAAFTILLGEVAGLFNQDIANSTKTVLTNIGFGDNDWGDLLIIATICCLAPLGEEALYRGLIFRGLFNSFARADTMMGVWSAAILSAALAAIVFALSHGGEGQEASVVAVIFLSGLAYGLCYAVTGSLWTAILAHSINNTIALGMVALPSDDISFASKAFILAAPIICALLIWIWARCLPRRGAQEV